MFCTNKMSNPTIKELQDDSKYELVYELEHDQVKEFVISRITTGSKLIRGYMYYQILMILAGLFFSTRSMVLALRGSFEPLFFLFSAIIFSFTLLILIHELLHAFAFKLTGAKKVSIGAFVEKFVFYAAADQHVLNKKQFTLVALMPLIVVKLASIIGIILFIGHPAIYFWIFIVCAHSLFCAGDIGMLDYFYQSADSQVFTYDVQNEKKSYFYRQKC